MCIRDSAKVESGEKIIFGDWVSEPPALVEALVNRADELKGVEIIHGMSPGPNAYVAPEYQGIFHHTSLFIGPKTRKAYAEKRIDYIGGTTFSRWPDLFAKNPDLNPHWAFTVSYTHLDVYKRQSGRNAQRIGIQLNHAAVPGNDPLI